MFINSTPENTSASSAPPRENPFLLDDMTGAIVDAALKIHIDLGPGLLESVYEAVLARALENRGFHVERQKVICFEEPLLSEVARQADRLLGGQAKSALYLDETAFAKKEKKFSGSRTAIQWAISR